MPLEKLSLSEKQIKKIIDSAGSQLKRHAICEAEAERKLRHLIYEEGITKTATLFQRLVQGLGQPSTHVSGRREGETKEGRPMNKRHRYNKRH